MNDLNNPSEAITYMVRFIGFPSFDRVYTDSAISTLTPSEAQSLAEGAQSLEPNGADLYNLSYHRSAEVSDSERYRASHCMAKRRFRKRVSSVNP